MIDTLGPLPPSLAFMNSIVTIIDAGSRYLLTIPATSHSNTARIISVVVNMIMYIDISTCVGTFECPWEVHQRMLHSMRHLGSSENLSFYIGKSFEGHSD